MAKITKFGKITERENGDLVFDGFEFDMEFEEEGEGKNMVELIIDRISSQLKEGVEVEVNKI